MNKLKLGWGNPDFLQEYWIGRTIEEYDFIKNPGYSKNCSDELKEQILNLHDKVQNAETDNRHIVIGAGATQVLYAALYAMKKIKGLKDVIASCPYFLRFPKIVELSGMNWNEHYKPYDDTIQIVTSPNNPDGRYRNTLKANAIHDLVYNWPQYVELEVIKEDEEIMIFSLAKALGFASTRIGWAIVKDEAIAKAMEEYIEFSSSGVSIDAQAAAFNHIANALQIYPSPWFAGKMGLAVRWKELYLLKDRVSFEIENSNGMFMWIKGNDLASYFGHKGIEYIPGPEFGADEQYGRLNIGCSKSDFEELIRRLKK